jgi:hypothetical protein
MLPFCPSNLPHVVLDAQNDEDDEACNHPQQDAHEPFSKIASRRWWLNDLVDPVFLVGEVWIVGQCDVLYIHGPLERRCKQDDGDNDHGDAASRENEEEQTEKCRGSRYLGHGRAREGGQGSSRGGRSLQRRCCENGICVRLTRAEQCFVC